MFGPSVETLRDGAFIPDEPENLTETANNVPVMAGVCDKEGKMIWFGELIFENLYEKSQCYATAGGGTKRIIDKGVIWSKWSYYQGRVVWADPGKCTENSNSNCRKYQKFPIKTLKMFKISNLKSENTENSQFEGKRLKRSVEEIYAILFPQVLSADTLIPLSFNNTPKY